MKYFDIIVTNPIMELVKLCYKVIPNYIFAIILFAFIIKLILFPFSLWSQVQSVKLAKMKPELDDIKAYYSHDWRLVLKEQKKLYKKEKYNSFISMLPLILQIPIILGVIRGMDAMAIMNETPSNILLPALSALSAFMLCYVQNLCNVLAKTLSFFAKWGLAIFLTIFSLYFTLTCGVGFGIYWTAGNAFAIGVQLLCNLIFNPKKHVTYEILPPIKKDKELIKRQKEKQKIDMDKFSKAKKYLVFYSEASGFYKYFKGMVEYILENSKIHVHYLTSDINDQVFKIDQQRFHPYYCSPKKLIYVLMKLDCKVAVLTLPDLHKYQYKRSIINKKIEYIYVDHSFCSLALMSRKQAYDYFDTIFCYGKHYNDEIRAMEAYYGSKEKTLVNTGYTLYHDLINAYQPKVNDKKTIIIAPSWQKDNILESCIDDMMKELADTDYDIIIRPHPEFIKLFPNKIEALKKKYSKAMQLDFSINILDADIIISDWSSVAWEFSYATNKPAIFINTPMKIMNPDWDKYGIMPIDIALREKIGVTIELNEMFKMKSKIEALSNIVNPRTIIEELMYDNTQASKESGEYIIKAVKNGLNK